ncbi:hypothetical protein KP509_18G083700 [Ceratopteris richardii]|uniref:peroxidase n=1 Tax=Ceratopteris richardii TaxID=49495 RepID=A0A8T2SW50_CERRI|nr:hypothetical protein KP509_18G083700 [Ceratopteris richardii]
MGRSWQNMNHCTRAGGRTPATLALLLSVVSCVAELAWHVEGVTIVGFYSATCPKAETIIQQEVQSRFNSDPTISAALLRMFFHDCFVQGCDASILIDPTPGNTPEKQSGPNLTLRGFDLIDAIKSKLEAECPGIVSCADIIAIATRDAVALVGGPSYEVKTGRFDGKRSRSSDANILPSPDSDVDQASSAFASQGLSLDDLVVLLGAHTTGFARCGFFSDRLYDFQGTGQPDPTMNPALVSRLKGVCPDPASGNSSDPTVFLDQGTRDAFDSSFYSQLQKHNGILRIDQVLQDDSRTSPLVSRFTETDAFFPAFISSITTLGALNLKTAETGEIRLDCRRVNPTTPNPPAIPPSPAQAPASGAPPPRKPSSPPPSRPTTTAPAQPPGSGSPPVKPHKSPSSPPPRRFPRLPLPLPLPPLPLPLPPFRRLSPPANPFNPFP